MFRRSGLQGEMLKLFGIQKSTESSKKSAQPDEEVDGFVILGETASERQHVPVEDVTGKCSRSTKEGQSTNLYPVRTDGTWTAQQIKQTIERFPVTAELLSDVPFTLAPHILTLQASFHDFPDTLHLPKNMNETVANFWYDFTLENSVLSDS
ncbi:UBAP1-MVB12-associated (UMA)-domain containing protein 1 isoform X1 [Chiloscyllium plagiosum]|uniref:UBAP1-MVB12-associated (UMA)-domain containing protein 1 isoform X1 n=2 Tax=Chiloscyllium plagiosum TaxID=36176 RepID=UPI001CB835FE|nr:UBAP1-MVB12-associated (UMA)-domain containing protein 1 isoform X1 [Chiloscyllium plagiosum]